MYCYCDAPLVLESLVKCLENHFFSGVLYCIRRDIFQKFGCIGDADWLMACHIFNNLCQMAEHIINYSFVVLYSTPSAPAQTTHTCNKPTMLIASRVDNGTMRRRYLKHEPTWRGSNGEGEVCRLAGGSSHRKRGGTEANVIARQCRRSKEGDISPPGAWTARRLPTASKTTIHPTVVRFTRAQPVLGQTLSNAHCLQSHMSTFAHIAHATIVNLAHCCRNVRQ